MNRIKLQTIIFICLLGTANIFAVPLSGNYNVGTGQTYTSLTKNAGFFGDVNSNGLSGNVTVFITSDLSEDGTKALNQWTETGVGGYTITILPSSNVLRTITINASKPILNFLGADRVTIDGRFGGSGKYLLFRNTSSTNPAVNFQNEARRNTITYCILESNNSSALGTSATVIFNTTTGANGNDSNTISFCDIRDCSDASGSALNAVLAVGTTTSANTFNDWNTITNCNIYNTFNAANSFVDIYVGDGNANMSVTNNSFYQTVIRTASASSAYFGMIVATTGNNNTISGNYFGGMAPLCGGSQMKITSGAGLFAFRIFQVGAVTTTTIQNNTIQNIDFTLTASGNYFFFKGIEVNVSGKADVIGNTIGSMTTTSSIILRYGGASGSPYPSAINFGYYWGGNSTVTGNVLNNNVGGISLTGAGTTAGDMTFTGIIVGFDRTLYNASATVSGNTVGNNLTSNFQNVLNVNTIFSGIITNCTAPGVITVTNNTVRNLTDGTTSTGASLRGIFHDGSAPVTITGNTVTELNTTSTSTVGLSGANALSAVIGIGLSGNSTGANTVSNNIVSGIRSTTAGAINTVTKGIAILGNGTGTLSANKIYDLTNTSTGAGPAIYGFCISGGSMTSKNNQVTITNGETSDRPIGPNPIPGINPPVDKAAYIQQTDNSNNTGGITALQSPILAGKEINDASNNKHGEVDPNSLNGMVIQGIHDEAGGTWNYYYNTVYIGGTVTTGANLTSCYTREILATNATFKNNLFYNNRTGNGTHLSINNNIAGGTFSSNYNVLISSNNGTIGRWIGTNNTFTAWKTSSAGDKQSWSTLNTTITQANLFNSVLTGDLRIKSGNTEAWIVSGKGIAVAGVNTDYEGTARSSAITSGTTDIGADEFVATPPSNPNATADFAPGSGVTSTYTLWGRTIAVINWGTGGTSYPTTVNIQYYTGVNPSPVSGGNYSNSNWVVSPVGTLTAASYDITYYFGDNETYTITSPSTNTRLAKYNPSSWEVFSTAGTGIYQSELTWANLTVKSRGMWNFSTYALTDVTSPLPVSITYFNAALTARDVRLSWATAWEINNKGFEVQRRSAAKDNSFTEWQTLGFVSGNGTTNNESDYNYTDSKLITGTYQYRLKQVDFNGNFEYFTLNSPSSVVIGTPAVFDVFQNYPNPSNPNTKIDYQIPFSGKISLKVYDISGKEVSTIIDKSMDAGYYTSSFDGTNLASGVYFYRLIASSADGRNFTKTMKMILVK